MANKKRLTGKTHRFPVGNKINNAGAKPGVCSVLREAGFTKDMIERKVADVLLMNLKETNDMKIAEDTCNFDRLIVSVVETAIRNADCARMDNLLEKIFGKTVNIKGTVSIENKGDVPANVTLGDAELIQRSLERALLNVNS